ncbi:MAG: NAD(P)-binding protein [Emcibacter sp.]|nr:NAD(P)-binding protein [Emcibacter sp.]
MTRHISIIGGGFHGICCAFLLAKKGYKISLIDTGKTLGGVMASIEHGDYIYDLGCHLFDNSYQKLSDLLKELLSDKFVPHKTVYASIVNGIKSENTEAPNLTNLGPAHSATILYELIERILSKADAPITSLADLVEANFGPSAAKALNDIYHKKTRGSFDALSSTIFDTILPSRLYFLEDDMARFLKKHPDLDEKIAVESMENPLDFYGDRVDLSKNDYRQFYPATRGMRGFCEQAEKKLEEFGVKIYKSTFCQEIKHSDKGCHLSLRDKGTQKTWQLDSDMTFWAGDVGKLAEIMNYSDDLTVYNHPVAFAVFYFNLPEDQIGKHSYIHNFDKDDLISRASAPSKYGAAVAPDGMGYICAELTTHVGSDVWENTEQKTAAVWQELMDMGYVRPTTIMPEPFILKTPAGYMLKKKGYKKALDNFKLFAKEYPNITFPEIGAFSRANIFSDVKNIINALED